jgi:hypothetical protein
MKIENQVILASVILLAALSDARAQTTFTKITTGAIVTDLGFSAGCAWGDYNNNGYLDLFVGNQQGTANYLYRNNGDGAFTKITTGNVITDGGSSVGCMWAGAVLPNGSFQLSLTGGIGLSYDIQTSNDLVGWSFLATVTNTSRTMSVIDTTATNGTQRFYRAVSR